MANQMTKKGARGVTWTLDRVATLFTQEWATLGVPQKVAADFAHRADMLADHIEKNAGIKRQALTGDDVYKEPGFNPEEIGMETAGPLSGDADENAYMGGEFDQQENRELRERQQSGALGIKVNPEPEAPSAGKQAAATLRRQLQAAVLAGANQKTLKAMALAAKVAEEEGEKKEDDKKAGEMPDFIQKKIDEKKDEKPEEKKAADEKKDEKVEEKKAGEMPDFIQKKIDEKKDDKPEEKKAGEMPPQFKENAEKKKEEAKDKPEEKKASHGFNLFAE
jgi:hypothetical protein